MSLWLIFFGLIGLIVLLSGLRVVRPVEMGVIETFGKFTSVKEQGLKWIIPIVQTMRKVNITERMRDVPVRDMITKDNLNAKVDLQVYYRVKPDQQAVKKSVYEVDNFELQIVNLAHTTARNIIGTMKFEEVNSKRSKLNQALETELDKETNNWGVKIVRVEMQEITPPEDVQETMNEILKANNKKVAATDFASAVEIEADGQRRASIKKAEGQRRASILIAEGKAKAFKLIEKSFKDNAKYDKALDVTKASLEKNSKVILTEKGISPQLILGDLPIKNK